MDIAFIGLIILIGLIFLILYTPKQPGPPPR